jgi:hypothetical protein
MEILRHASQLKAAQSQFEQSFWALPHHIVEATIGYQGGTFDAQVIWVPSLSIWGYFGLPPHEKPQSNRYWNPFGIDEPGSQVLIVCEINPPIEGLNPATGGLFLRDSNANITLAHRCRFSVTGGIRAEYFLKHFTGQVISPATTRPANPLARVAEHGSATFGQDMAKFIREVHQIKERKRAENAARARAAQSRPTTH